MTQVNGSNLQNQLAMANQGATANNAPTGSTQTDNNNSGLAGLLQNPQALSSLVNVLMQLLQDIQGGTAGAGAGAGAALFFAQSNCKSRAYHGNNNNLHGTRDS